MKDLLTAASVAMALGAGLPAAPAHAGADPYLGDIVYYGFGFCPRGWTEADGQLLPIASYQSLFSLYGTTYGGDGRTTFGLPDLRGRVAISQGQGTGLPNYSQGQKAGQDSVTLTRNELATHLHTATLHATSSAARTTAPADGSLSAAAANIYTTRGDLTTALEPGSVTIANAGSSAPVGVVQPYLVLRACVALQGLFPPRN